MRLFSQKKIHKSKIFFRENPNYSVYPMIDYFRFGETGNLASPSGRPIAT